jgi:hypothetical protein
MFVSSRLFDTDSTANHREVKYKELRAKETKLKKMEELIKQKEKAAQEVNNNRTKLESTFSCRDGFTASLFFLYAHGLTCITRWFSIYIFHTMNMALIITYYNSLYGIYKWRTNVLCM